MQAELKGFSRGNYNRLEDMKDRAETLKSAREEKRKNVSLPKLGLGLRGIGEWEWDIRFKVYTLLKRIKGTPYCFPIYCNVKHPQV